MLKLGIGHSDEVDTLLAVKNAIQQCQESLGDAVPNAALVFASESYDFQTILDEVCKVYPGIQISGCSSYGEISSREGVLEDSLAILLINSPDVTIRTGLIEKISTNAQSNAFEVAQDKLKDDKNKPALCCLFSDGILGNVSATLRGLQSYFGKNFPIVGGNACDDWKFQKVYQFNNDKVLTDSSTFMTFSEPLVTSSFVMHGRRPFTSLNKHVVTKAERNIVYSIDNMPTSEFYRTQIGNLHSFEPYALLIKQDENDKSKDKDIDRYSICSPFRINPDGSIFFSAEVPEQSTVAISKLSDPNDTLEAANNCVKKAIENFSGKKIELALVFSCALRKEILGTDVQKEIDLIKAQLPANTPIFGFYTFGEIGPFDDQSPSLFHNETIVLSLIGE